MQESSSVRTIRNSAWSFLGFALPIGFSIFITPIIVFTLGLKTYGVFVLLSTGLNFLSLIDLGISEAVIKYLSEYEGAKDYRRLDAIAGSMQTLFLFIGLCGFFLCFLVGHFGFSLSASLFAPYKKYTLAIYLVGCLYFLSSVNSTYSIALISLQRFDINSKLSIAASTLSSIGTLVVVLLGYSVTAIFAVQLLVVALYTFTVAIVGHRLMPALKKGFGFDWEEIKKYYVFGLVTSLNNISTSFLLYLDRLIVPFYVGPTNLTYYSLPGAAANKIPGAAASLTSVIFPMTSNFEGGQDRERIKYLYVRSLRLIAIAAAGITITLIAFSKETMTFWLSSDFASKTSTILIILAITNFILALMNTLSQFLLGMGKLSFLAFWSVVMAVLNTTLLVILLPPFGIVGAAWAYLLSLLPVAYMFYYTETHILKLTDKKKRHGKTFLQISIVSLVLLLLDDFVFSHLIVNLATLLAIGVVSFISFIIIYNRLGFFEAEDWQEFERFFRISILRKKYD